MVRTALIYAGISKGIPWRRASIKAVVHAVDVE
jgi:hypothetical protein